MLWSVTVEFEDGRIDAVGPDYLSLEEATIAALALADRLGPSPPDDPRNRPVRVRIHMDGQFELSVTIFKDGLLPPAAPRRSASIWAWRRR